MSMISNRTKVKERPKFNREELRLSVKLEICLSNREMSNA